MQNLNSDDLRRKLDENNESMNTLADDNQRIVELLAQRGLKAIEKTADEDLVFSADKMILFNADGAEVFNTDWPNPLVNPDQYEAHRRMAEWVSKFQKVREDRVPLTADELKAGGWWCADVSGECAAAFESKSINAYNSEAWGTARPGWAGCLFSGGEVARTMSIEGGEKQIHRIGNEFYWGAP